MAGLPIEIPLWVQQHYQYNVVEWVYIFIASEILKTKFKKVNKKSPKQTSARYSCLWTIVKQ